MPCITSIFPPKKDARLLRTAPSSVYFLNESISLFLAEKNFTAEIFENTSASRPLIFESCEASSTSYFIFLFTKKETTVICKTIQIKKIKLIVDDSLVNTTKTPTKTTKNIKKL